MLQFFSPLKRKETAPLFYLVVSRTFTSQANDNLKNVCHLSSPTYHFSFIILSYSFLALFHQLLLFYLLTFLSPAPDCAVGEVM